MVWLHLFKIQGLAKLIYGDKSQKSGFLVVIVLLTWHWDEEVPEMTEIFHILISDYILYTYL